MNTKYLTALLLASLTFAMASPVSVFAFSHGVVGCTYFAIDINGTGGVNGTQANPYVFKEPNDGYCDNFNVTVWIIGVTDLYGYEFVMYWDQTYFNMVSYNVNQLWPAQFKVLPTATYNLKSPFKAVVAAEAPSAGISGDFALVTFVFHIKNDVCYGEDIIDQMEFWLSGEKASNSCSQSIPLCSEVNGWITFKAVQPKAYILPAKTTCTAVGTKFTLSVQVKNVVKMTDFDITINWSGYDHEVDPCGFNHYWTVLLTTDPYGQDVVINPLFDATTATIDVVSPPPTTPWYGFNPWGSVHVAAEIPATGDPINATNPTTYIWLFNVTFTQQDPWYCGAQPEYTPLGNHDWALEVACTDITFAVYPDPGTSTISTLCTLNQGTMWLGYQVAIGGESRFCFTPVPGDLNGDGIVDVSDLMIEAAYYGQPGDCSLPPFQSPMAYNAYYNLNNIDGIDIYDLVIVAKNFGRTAPTFTLEDP
jgi:hypothetical protein